MRPAVVLLSGGLDSSTVLAIARDEGYACHCLTIEYGQRHRAEIDASRRIAVAAQAVDHRIIAIDLTQFGGSALTDHAIAVPVTGLQPGIPVTYVPARNTIFLSLALAYAEVNGASDIFFGANAVDYSGYPDCRPEYMRAFETLANVATKASVEGRHLKLHTPLLTMSKADIITRGTELGVDFGLTVSCYRASPDGKACGVCDSCRLRRAGFETAGIPDPTRYRAAPD